MLPRFGKILPQSPNKDPKSPEAFSWAYIREQQMKILDLPHTAVACTIDTGNLRNIHPKDKEPIGRRLALLAEKCNGTRSDTVQGPIFSKLITKNNSLIVSFKNNKGLKTTDGQPPKSFWLAGDDSKWIAAKTKIENNKVILSWDKDTPPKYVRYAFAGFPQVNLVNAAGIPALPFRTDTMDPGSKH
jgi:sialate O-acetylesterase